MFKVFKERKTTLFNGKKVKEGDRVLFISSDGYKHEDIIRRREFNCTHADTGEKLKKEHYFSGTIVLIQVIIKVRMLLYENSY